MSSSLPALYLYPLNGTFAPKRLPLVGGSVVKFQRHCCDSADVPTVANGRFESLVLSRQHAEVWAEGGKIFVRDTKSMNGTYLNGVRLGTEREESAPAELHTGDVLDLAYDILNEDGATIKYPKTSARVVCAFTEEDARAAEIPTFTASSTRAGNGAAGVMAAL